ncbi:hypothetical protein ACQ86N_32645 [Puia sp. P3]|uniref:hypothetical protein n=1 Tax=Puia sp. P3 TaxID=3423952 RepID=UPI003D66C3B1
MRIVRSFFLFSLITPVLCMGQQQPNPDSVRAAHARDIARASEEYRNKVFTHADTLRGSVGPERAWWDIQRYDITVKPDFLTKTAPGSDLITYQVVSDDQPGMQLDLQAALHIDSVIFNGKEKLSFTQEGNVWHVRTPKQKVGSVNTVQAYFSGLPHESVRPPWSGGWTFAKDSLGRPWMTVTCQGIGASLWYPCKDLQYDEPDKGGSVTMIVPDSLVGVANGRLQYKNPMGTVRRPIMGGRESYQQLLSDPLCRQIRNLPRRLSGREGTS